VILDNVKGTVPGVVGGGVTSGGFFMTWMTADGLPIVHFLAGAGTAVAGFATGIYYFSKWLKLRKAP
jgi:hypothetical protein